jgi:hypothetical protein
VNDWADAENPSRSKTIGWVAAAVVVAGIAGFAGYHYFTRPATPQKEALNPPPPLPLPPPPPADDSNAIQHPIPDTAGVASNLPALNQSDATTRKSLTDILGARAFEQFLVPDSLIRHIVVTVDNLPRKKAAVTLWPVKPTSGSPVVIAHGDEGAVMDPASYARYAPFMRMVETADVKKLAGAYFNLYPLFQQAYEYLGYPDRFFNDRLVEVVDHLLAAPEPRGSLELVQPKVLYEFADPQLEALSAGQKMMIRIGPENEARVKAKLRDLRGELANKAPAATAR